MNPPATLFDPLTFAATWREDPDPLADLDMRKMERTVRQQARALQRRRERTPACSCEPGPMLGRDEDGDPVCRRCGRRAPW